MIKNVELFRKLYPVSAPVPEHFPYYLERLRLALGRTPPLDMPWLERALVDFEDLERTYTDPVDYVKAWRNRLVTILNGAQVVMGQNARWEPSKELLFPKMELVEQHARRRLVRVDLVSANYAALRAMAIIELPPTWEAFCKDQDMHPALACSKAFRQSVLGLCNPKRQQAYQSEVTDEVAELIGQWSCTPMVRRSSDELVYCTEDVRLSKGRLFQELDKDIQAKCRLPCRVEYFDLIPLGFMRGYLWRSFESASAEHPTSVKPFAVPGNRYYLALTRAVLREKVVDHQDISYMDDGDVAQWAFDFNREVQW